MATNAQMNFLLVPESKFHDGLNAFRHHIFVVPNGMKCRVRKVTGERNTADMACWVILDMVSKNA